ncbi:hypothetical protein [Actinacidiphila oryziradicis]|uniref:Uncharacterized protein n=1 Tax=Actinacidiphila oryziradicis TaxID=2571141 RepID=A0A4U0SW70_9ACTN|nr:hypothetical protein [Actinacidiphila oryziradicis]TKA04745.1 hypothetical protein FCI23_34885 [Actinacidiphila oryziradicis]
MKEIEGSLEARIAARASASEDNVRDVFATYGLPLVSTPARPRALRLHRLRVAGKRTGAVAPGPFDSTVPFTDGVTALVASNFRGKTSVLELVTWCLRGTPRELQGGVRRWLSALDLDVVVAGQPLGFRLDLADGEIVSALVLAGPDVAQLARTRVPVPARSIVALLRAASPASFTEQVQALMLDRLDLQPLVSSVQGNSTQTHGWAAYYGAIYLPAGGDKVLLGDQAMAGLPGRLLQVFLDLPATAALARVKTAWDVRATESYTRVATAEAFTEARRGERERVEADLTQARTRLAALGPAAGGNEESLTELAEQAVALARAVADAQELWEELMHVYRRARAARQRDLKLLNDVRESAIARRLFHGLDPTTCPRCDQDIEEDRRQRERSSHACAVCDRPVEGDDEAPQQVIAETEDQLGASAEAERAAKDALERAEAELARLTAHLAAAQERLRRAQPAAQLPALVAARESVLRYEGALSVLPEAAAAVADPVETMTLNVLKSAAKVLEEDSREGGTALFAALNEQIAELGRRFGIVSLESVEIDRAGRLRITKDGSARDWFSKQSAGERLRLRIAVVVALLRVGAAHGVSTHPGLLLIDSPKAEEVQDLDAHTLLRELAELARENRLQVVITTADPELAHDVLSGESIIEAKDGSPLW